jgi:hypothetical protein
MLEPEGPSRAVHQLVSMADLSAHFRSLPYREHPTGNDGSTAGNETVLKGQEASVTFRGGDNDAVNDDGTEIEANRKLLSIGSGLDHDDDNDGASSCDESDIEEFLEHARQVIAENNTSYDSTSFRDFESLLNEAVMNHFLDDDQDEDSMVSTSSFSGYLNERGLRQKSSLLNKSIISDIAFHRLQGIIARKKGMVPECNPKAETSDENNDSMMSSPESEIKVDEIDQSTDAMATMFAHSFNKARNSRGQRFHPNNSMRCENDRRDYSKFNSNTMSTAENPPTKHRRKKPGRSKAKNSKTSRKSKEAHKAPREHSERPPLSPFRTDRLENAFLDFTFDLSSLNSTSDGDNKISNLIRSPEKREKVLRFLKERAPSLHDSVLARLQMESHVQDSPREIIFESESANFRTPEKRPTGYGRVSYDDPQVNRCREPYWYINVDTASVILPSMFREKNSTVRAPSQILKGSDTDQAADVFLTAEIDRVLRGKQEKEGIMSENEHVLEELKRRFMSQQESMAQRGMALIHKFRAKRKAALQARYLQQSEQNQQPSAAFHQAALGIEEINRDGGHDLSPKQLGSYSPSLPSSSPSSLSSLEEKKERLRKLKEKRKRASLERKESEKSLLRYESHDESFVKAVSSTKESTPITSLPSPFQTVVFPRSKGAVGNYETLSEAFSHHPNMVDKSSVLEGWSTSSSTKRTNTCISNGDFESDDTNRMITPESPDWLSPFGDHRLSDLSDNSNRIPNVFEDNVWYDDDGCLIIQSSFDAGNWSEMSFQSDKDRFAESSTNSFPKNHGHGFSTSTQMTTTSAATPPTLEGEATPSKVYNDSFDEIVFRQTPSQKISVSPGQEQSPHGVADLFDPFDFFQERKSNDLAFVDDEENDPLFTDKEDSFDQSFSEGSVIHKPVFLSPRLFEI